MTAKKATPKTTKPKTSRMPRAIKKAKGKAKKSGRLNTVECLIKDTVGAHFTLPNDDPRTPLALDDEATLRFSDVEIPLICRYIRPKKDGSTLYMLFVPKGKGFGTQLAQLKDISCEISWGAGR